MKLSACIVLMVKFGLTSCEDIPPALLNVCMCVCVSVCVLGIAAILSVRNTSTVLIHTAVAIY